LGRRIAKKVNGVVVEKYLWQGLTRLLAVYDGGDNLLMRFEYADARMPIAVTKGGITYYLTYDQVGSLRSVTDASGNIVKRIDYDSFGNISSDTNPGFIVPFGFAGGLHDRDTGLVKVGFRDYDPNVGRWAAKDPILFAGGDVDLYGHVGNNPVNFVDPLGLWTYSLGVTVYAGAGFGGGGGTFFNVGHNPNSGWLSGGSFSITGVAGGGATAGAGYGLGISTTITNACNTKQLLGPFFPCLFQSRYICTCTWLLRSLLVGGYPPSCM
jgi:RHS repeat-associated protein